MIADLQGVKAAAYAVALRIARPEAGEVAQGWKVLRRGNTFVACTNKAFESMDPQHRVYLSA